MTQEVSHCFLTAEAWAQSQASYMAYVVDKVSPAQAFSQSKFVFPASTISPVIRIRTSFIYYR